MIALLAACVAVGFCPRPAPNHPTMPPLAHQPPVADRPTPHGVEPTRSLFVYHRDDHTPEQVTTVQIDATRVARATIHPNVFGNFIEHLGGVVYEGLWAQALLNPNLEKIEEGDTAPPAWKLGDKAVWIEGGYLSPRAVRLLPAAGANLTQIVRLPVKRTRRYQVHLVARAMERRGHIAIALLDPKSNVKVCGVSLAVTSADWQPLSCQLSLPRGALSSSPELRFAVVLVDSSAVDVDQIELFPNDNVNGLDPDVLKRTQEWHPPVLRWPGGNFASGYHWQDGIGPPNRRPTRRNAAWGGIEPNHFGTQEFMDFCHRVGAQPQLTVNAGDGTPEEAAAWVRYCNASANDEYGRLRAANGSPAPFGIKIWEVGNELYGGWQIGHTDPDGNAARYVRFRDAMLRADPTIKLIATGKAEEFTPAGLQRDYDWNHALLQAALANGGTAPDWLSIHPLVPLPGIIGRATYETQYESAMAQPQFLGETLLPQLTALIRNVVGPQARTRIAVTEWGIIVGGSDWRQSPNHDSLAGAIFNALTLNAMLRNSDRVTLANMTALLHGGGIKKWNGVTYVDPQYYTQQLYTLAHPHSPVQTVTTGPGRDVPVRGQLPAVENVPDLDAVAALGTDDKTLILFAVNRHLTAARPLRLSLQGFAAHSVSATILTALDPRTGNGWDHPNTVRPRPFPIPAWQAGMERHWQVEMPPHSLVVFTFHR
jgi:alpha-L-arabinofuranosidase